MAIRGSFILCAAGAAGLFAQAGNVAGPVAGYVVDSRVHALRVIRGIPGASLIGDPVDLGGAIANAWVSPKSDAALAITTQGAPKIVRLSGSTAAEKTVDGLVAPERAVFSPSGTALALVTAGSVRVIKGLPDAPVVAGTVELPNDRGRATAAMAAGKMRRPGGGAVAVSDDGDYVLYGAGTAVELLGVKGDSRKLTEAAPGALLAFAPNGHDAAVVDGQAVALFKDVAGAATVRRFDGVGGGKDAAFSPDGGKLFVATKSVMAIDTSTGNRTELTCDCTPTGLVRMGSAFRLNELGTGPLWLLDATAEPKVVFVPATK